MMGFFVLALQIYQESRCLLYMRVYLVGDVYFLYDMLRR